MCDVGSGREEEGPRRKFGGSFEYRSLGNEAIVEAPNAVKVLISEVGTE